MLLRCNVQLTNSEPHEIHEQKLLKKFVWFVYFVVQTGRQMKKALSLSGLCMPGVTLRKAKGLDPSLPFLWLEVPRSGRHMF